MTSGVVLRRARSDEAGACYRCIEDARAYHSSLGFVQWGPDYPTLADIEADIASGTGYAFARGDELLGYCCVVFGDEPAYAEIDGAWLTDSPYAVVHRMAFAASSRGRGMARTAFDLIKALCEERGVRAIRVDTQAENTVMQRVLSREGFLPCGTVTFNGGPKLAYEWDA